MKISRDVYLVGSGILGFDWTHPADCNVYLVDAGEALVLIDAGTGLSITHICQNIRMHGFEPEHISHVLLTHLHADHAGGAAAWRALSGASVGTMDIAKPILEQASIEEIDLPRAKAAGFYPVDYEWPACPVDLPLQDGQHFSLGKYKISVYHTPGHSRYDVSFYMESEGQEPILFSGDTVFYDGKISMLSTWDFNLTQVASSIERLTQLEVKMLLPGHGQLAMNHGSEHIQKAHRIFTNLGVPKNIG